MNCPVHGRAMRGGFCPACAARKVNRDRAPEPKPAEEYAFPPDDPEQHAAPPKPKAFNPQEMVEREVAARELHAQALAQIAVALGIWVEHTTGRKVFDDGK